MRVYEIFNSIDGEVNTFYQGRLTTFIRLAGCNLNCPWCDTKQAIDKESGIEMTTDEIMHKVREIGCKNITITGGEPLLQKAELYTLTYKLNNEHYLISIETNGSFYIGGFSTNVSFVMDYKCFNERLMNIDNLNLLSQKDTIKFIIEDREDYEKALRVKSIISSFKYLSQERPIYAFSAVIPRLEPFRLLKWLIEDKQFDAVLNVQIHKLINVK